MRFFTILLLILYSFAFSVDINNLNAKFICQKQEGDSTKVISGTIRFQEPHTALITTHQPQEQQIYIVDHEMIIYSVTSNTAFAFASESNITIPYLSDFFPAMHEDFGLSQSGYAIKEAKAANDTLVTTWQNSKDKSAEDILIYSLDNFIVKVAATTNNDTPSKTILLSDHLPERICTLPQKIEIFDANKTRLKMTTLDSVEINAPSLPAIEFDIPKDASIKQYQW